MTEEFLFLTEYIFIITNVGLVSLFFIPSPVAIPRIKTLFPEPRVPSNKKTSPPFRLEEKVEAKSRVFCSQLERYVIKFSWVSTNCKSATNLQIVGFNKLQIRYKSTNSWFQQIANSLQIYK
ncbi:hypothetical protein A2300_04255 [Candidatus Falkowbacteria bacterium RIFOXYB2_FULL_35_7]|uniref:Uncharacterized protein n=1 Tax=Candidatus Falkowbacteria bacterium RIFOXYC2_FULL_36_12 TaxID=1798002 RepID=A0A1F5T374_9BACT|nr:MAG: hypothetical protein A2300_04255 [Candidatus Falkowbacteria bacterium RIFOXYB2_FULL_35_7]OGF33398.1 MAG: hypothetical protein A2478_01710 [Candidatus Falkowbacteria bacterium RIFOXYC2_FULL_36_12]